jgi:hypothetical protein
MNSVSAILICQGTVGAFDTIWYHEKSAALPSLPSARLELKLHAARDVIYFVLFGTLGWLTWDGLLAWLLGLIVFAELCITLWDLGEEDRTRSVPAGERTTHAVMGVIYGAFFARLLPNLITWQRATTGFGKAESSAGAWVLAVFAVGVVLSGLRDLWASTFGVAGRQK